jgi:7,8-dihydropterin-6-yl-methyl-4-(beta-D-ribofuranosyl)aminobenzene 5'-phosphate synthase
MHAETRRGTETRNVLVDFGFTPEALINNTNLVGVDPAGLDALVLSHGHYDHFGGLAGFLRATNGKLKPKLPIYIGGEEAFCSREWTAPPVRGDFGALDRKALEDANLTVTYSEGPALIADHGFTTGHIDQTSFEKLLSPSAMKIGVDRGMGCYADKLPEDERAQAIIPDQFRHEIATAFKLRGRGLIVLTSCSHRGVINAIKQAQATSGVNKVHAVIGGFHLAPYKEDYVRDTVTAIKDMDIDYVIPLHCTALHCTALHCTALVSRSTRWPRPKYRTNSCAPIPARGSSSAPDRNIGSGARSVRDPRHGSPLSRRLASPLLARANKAKPEAYQPT